MPSKHLEDLKDLIKTASDSDFQNVISKGALEMNDLQINTVSFVFWLIYMVETAMDGALKQAWTIATRGANKDEIEELNKLFTEKIRGEKSFKVESPDYLSQKIRIYRTIFGETEHVSFLWKINTIRNDLSHHRIDQLRYEGEPLSKREVKEQILLDFFEGTLNPDLSKADFWKKMSEAEKNTYQASLERLDHELDSKKAAYLKSKKEDST